MAYEDGMNINYDAIRGLLNIRFRGKDYQIRKKFPDHSTAIKEGEEHCRRLGWDSRAKPSQ